MRSIRRLTLVLLLVLGLAVPATAALQTASGTVTVTTGAVGTTFTVSGLAFQPKAVILHWSGRATAGTGEADVKAGLGVFTGTAARRAWGTQIDHAAAAATTDHVWRDDAAVATLTTAGATDGLADVDAILSDGFRLIVDDVFSAGLLVGYLAIGGDDLTDTAIIDFTNPSGTGDQDITTVGFALDTGLDDKLVLIVGPSGNAVNTPGAWSAIAVGAAAGNSIGQAVTFGESIDGADPTTTWGYSRAGEIIAYSATVDALTGRASVTAWLSNGFRLNWAENASAAGAVRFFALVLKGGRYSVGDFTTATDTSNHTEAVPYQPTGLLLVSHNKAQSTSDTAQQPYEWSFGVASSASARSASAFLSKDAANTEDAGISFRDDEMYVNLSTATTIVVEGLMDLVSFDAAPTFTYVMDDADPSGAFAWYVVFASVPSAVTCAGTRLMVGVGC